MPRVRPLVSAPLLLMMIFSPNSFVRKKEVAQGEEEEEVGGQRRAGLIGTPTPSADAPIGPTQSGLSDARNRRKLRGSDRKLCTTHRELDATGSRNSQVCSVAKLRRIVHLLGSYIDPCIQSNVKCLWHMLFTGLVRRGVAYCRNVSIVEKFVRFVHKHNWDLVLYICHILQYHFNLRLKMVK